MNRTWWPSYFWLPGRVTGTTAKFHLHSTQHCCVFAARCNAERSATVCRLSNCKLTVAYLDVVSADIDRSRMYVAWFTVLYFVSRKIYNILLIESNAWHFKIKLTTSICFSYFFSFFYENDFPERREMTCLIAWMVVFPKFVFSIPIGYEI